ncbi:IS1296UK transposase [Mycoplasma mycoides subsp. mycoides]|nr:IS1296UK transposase [Mycoplasma mycoides subsp. mycoides]
MGNVGKKLKIVKEAKKLNIKKSTYLANKYDISVDTVESLVNRFEAFGIEGLINKEKKPYYSAKLKLKIVLYKLKLITHMMKSQKSLILFIHQL